MLFVCASKQEYFHNSPKRILGTLKTFHISNAIDREREREASVKGRRRETKDGGIELRLIICRSPSITCCVVCEQ